MVISYKNKFIFFHIPKCAGSAIRDALLTVPETQSDPSAQHIKPVQMDMRLKKEGHDMDTFYKFAFVRNPWARTVSGYYFTLKCVKCYHDPDPKFDRYRLYPWLKPTAEEGYIHREYSAEDDYWIKQVHLDVTDPIINFRKHIRKMGNIGIPEVDKNPYTGWISQCNFNYIGRVENIQNDLNKICENIGITPVTVPHSNVTEHNHYTEYYDDETREIITSFNKKDIEYCGYKFG